MEKTETTKNKFKFRAWPKKLWAQISLIVALSLVGILSILLILSLFITSSFFPSAGINWNQVTGVRVSTANMNYPVAEGLNFQNLEPSSQTTFINQLRNNSRMTWLNAFTRGQLGNNTEPEWVIGSNNHINIGTAETNFYFVVHINFSAPQMTMHSNGINNFRNDRNQNTWFQEMLILFTSNNASGVSQAIFAFNATTTPPAPPNFPNVNFSSFPARFNVYGNFGSTMNWLRNYQA